MTELSPAEADWTTDPETGRSNSSPQFQALAAEVEGLLRRSGGLSLSPQWAASTARLIVAKLAHEHGLTPGGDTPGASIVGDPEPPHRLTVRLIPHRDLAGVDQGPQPHRELQHTEACDALKYGQRCPFDDRDDMDDWPADPGEYEGWYWAGRNWTAAGWEYDAGIEWQRADAVARETAEQTPPGGTIDQ